MPLSGNTPYPGVSIIIVTWNALPLIKQCLPSVVATEYPNFEIILADNASTDGSSTWVEKNYPEIKVIRHPENWLFSRGNNAAIAHASGEYIVLLNNDVETPPGWLHPLVASLVDAPDVAAVQPKILQYDQRDHFEYAGAAGGYVDRFGYPFSRGRLFFTLEKDSGQYDTAQDVDWATGAALLLRRSALETVGLLDEHFEMHMEEIDLCWRLWRGGYRVRVEPESEVYHIGGGSLQQGNPRKVYYNFRNSLLLLYKNLPPSHWRRLFPRRLLLDGIAMLRTLVSGRPRETVAIVRAYRDAHRMRKHYTSQRPTSVTGKTPPSYQGSIVIDYFLRGRKMFSMLPPERWKGTRDEHAQ